MVQSHRGQLSTSFSPLRDRGTCAGNAPVRSVVARASSLDDDNDKNTSNNQGNVCQARMPTMRRHAKSGTVVKKCFLWLPLLLLEMMRSARVSLAQSTTEAPTFVATPLVSPTALPTGSPTFEPIVYNFDDFPYCNLTTQEMMEVNVTASVDPCILFDIKPNLMQIIPYRTKTITIVQVTPAMACRDARDGAVTGVELLNAQNNGSGIAIGFHKDFHVQWRFVSLIAGNADQMGKDVYGRHHAAVLTSAVQALEASYIVGGCSFVAAFEKEPALLTKTMVLAQVGPPGFYADDNPYLFGVHINSDEYPIPAIRDMGFAAAAVPVEDPTSLTRQPVIVVYRNQSEFFRSTCESAVRTAREIGFVNITEVIYDPGADHDGDEVVNEKDEEFLLRIADETCPPGSGQSDDAFNPAIFACFLTEQDIILKRWKENGCRPASLWLTAATWTWADENPTIVPYMQGGGQWHEALQYSDRFFTSGTDVLLYNEERFGYYGSYDTVVAYAIPVMFAQHLEAFYRVVDDPDPDSDFGTEEGYELLRRAMVVLNIDTIFGPLSYNEDQRNVGRGAAATQWQWHNVNNESVFGNLLISPASQAEAVIVFPAPSAVQCSPGYYVNETIVTTGDAILESKCAQCPAGTFTAESNQQLQCQACPEGSSTDGAIGQSNCSHENENLLSPGTLAFGYIAAGITWILSIAFAGWLFKHRNDPVVLLSQLEFMLLVCLGAVISSSTIFALSVQAGPDEDTTSASLACQAAPFLYTTGWVLQYASLSAKSWRLHRIMNGGRRVKVTARETGSIVAAILALDWIVVITWTVVYPLEVSAPSGTPCHLSFCIAQIIIVS
jgi:7 transmembrane sweet-taste receptor of 3 GCPR/Tyrosine-protein kinase ephrin type A/B receptor-like